jgi:hypothetical protein
VVLVELHSLECRSPANQLVAELGLVVVAAGAIDFLVRILGIVWKKVKGLVFVRGYQKARR